MRGSALIFHSLDSETLEKMDLESLNPECDHETDDYNNRLYKQTLQSETHSEDKIPQRVVTNSESCAKTTTTQPYEISPCRSQPLPIPQSVKSTIGSPTSAYPILDHLAQNSLSPPLRKSNYQIDQLESRSKDKNSSCGDINDITNHNSSKNGVKRAFHSTTNSVIHSQNGQNEEEMKEKTFTSLPSLGSGMPLSRLNSNTRNGREILRDGKGKPGNGEGNSGQNQNPLSRFLFNFRQQKEDKSRLDIYNLPPKLREELKRIYVY